MSRVGNKYRAKYAVTFKEHEVETPLDTLIKFVDWTHEKHLKNYIEIGEMLHVTPNEANRLLCLASVPDDDGVVKRMKELMYESKNHI